MAVARLIRRAPPPPSRRRERLAAARAEAARRLEAATATPETAQAAVSGPGQIYARWIARELEV